jgi:hypothetical protein
MKSHNAEAASEKKVLVSKCKTSKMILRLKAG